MLDLVASMQKTMNPVSESAAVSMNFACAVRSVRSVSTYAEEAMADMTINRKGGKGKEARLMRQRSADRKGRQIDNERARGRREEDHRRRVMAR